MKCKIKSHFTCDGTGRVCKICGESEAACKCGDEQETEDCEECEGTGNFCVEHEAPSGNGKTCDKAK